ncbi:MAG: hypothetical protein R2749_21065 [Acidimicrobiales bacterium]
MELEDQQVFIEPGGALSGRVGRGGPDAFGARLGAGELPEMLFRGATQRGEGRIDP